MMLVQLTGHCSKSPDGVPEHPLIAGGDGEVVACAGFVVAPAPPLAKRRYLGTKVLRSDRYASLATSYLRTPDLLAVDLAVAGRR
jgi:hypothetical protein